MTGDTGDRVKHRRLSILELADHNRPAFDRLLFLNRLGGSGTSLQVGRQRFAGDVIAPAPEDLGQLALSLGPGGNAVFNDEAGFLPHVLDAAYDLARQALEAQLGRDGGVYADQWCIYRRRRPDR